MSSRTVGSNSIKKSTLQVYRFTLYQIVKSRANIIMFVTLFLVAAASIPVASLIMGGREAPGISVITLSTGVMTVEDYLGEDQLGFDAKYLIQYGYSIVTMMLSIFSTTYIVRALVEEKSSKLAETLMTSLKPMALLLGKVLAVMTFMFGMLIVLAVTVALSWFATGIFLDTSIISEKIASVGITADLLNLGVITVIAILISMLLAYLFFSLIAGLAGAGCSNMDEIEGANMAAMWVILLGYLVSCFALGFSENLTAVLSLCPVVSAFAAPVYYLFGEIGLGVLMASWAIQILMIAGLLWLASKVYGGLMMYQGNRIKMTQIFKMIKEVR